MKKLIYTVILIVCLLLPSIVHADDDTTIVLAESGTTAPVDENELLIQEINTFLAVLKDDGFDGASKDQLIEIHEKYDSLTMAEKVNVENFNILAQAEEALHLEYVSPSDRTRPTEKIGCEYQFELSGEKNETSIIIRYMTDSDANAVVERPDSIILASPSNTEVLIQQGMTEVSTTKISLIVQEASDQLRLDIKSGEEGIWKVKTDNTCYFDVVPFQGEIVQESAKEAEPSEKTSTEENIFESETEPNIEEKPTKKNINVGIIVKIIICIAVIAGLFIGLRYIKKKNSGERTQKEDEEEQHLKSDADYEKEMKEMRAFLKARQSAALDDAEDEPEVPEQPQEAETDKGYTEYTESPSGYVERTGDGEEPTKKPPFGSRM